MISETIRRTAWQIAGVFLAVRTASAVSNFPMMYGLMSTPVLDDHVDRPTFLGLSCASVIFTGMLTAVCFYMGRPKEAVGVEGGHKVNLRALQELGFSIIGIFLIAISIPDLYEALFMTLGLVFTRSQPGSTWITTMSTLLKILGPVTGIGLGLWLFLGGKGLPRIGCNGMVQGVNSDRDDTVL